MKDTFEQLKSWLKEHRYNFITVKDGEQISGGCETCGFGAEFEEIPEIDEDALWKEIDEFCKTFEAKEKP